MLEKPAIAPEIKVEIPAANGYVLHSRRTHKSLAIVDLDFLQKEVFAKLAAQGGPDKLVLFVTRDVAFYSLSDATVCCSVGTHGVSGAQPFVLASYFDKGVMPKYTDVQGITQQLGEWLNDPLGNNKFPRWLKPPANLACGGSGESTAYLLEQPAGSASPAGRYHLENMALLSWFEEAPNSVYSFPDAKALPAPAQPCVRAASGPPTASPLPGVKVPKHKLIGYWEGY